MQLQHQNQKSSRKTSQQNSSIEYSNITKPVHPPLFNGEIPISSVPNTK